MKQCTKCKSQLPLEDFPVNRTKKDGRGTMCKSCKKAYNKSYYVKTKDIHKASRTNTRRNWRAKIKEYIDDIKSSTPCADCGKFYQPVQMDFDHLRDKEFDIARGSSLSFSRVKEEIAKCELVCANCHRLRTHSRL